jgi:hypothetical protein
MNRAYKRERAKAYIRLALSDGKTRFLNEVVNARPDDISVYTVFRAREELIWDAKLIEQRTDEGIVLYLPGPNYTRAQAELDRELALASFAERLRERQQARQRRMADQAFKRKLAARKRRKELDKARLDQASAAVDAAEREAGSQ